MLKAYLKDIAPYPRWFHLVNRESLRADLIAGLTGAVIVLPQGVAFALIAGLPPAFGLYTAMITAVVAALFGSSLHLISGPTTAISLTVFAAISQFAQPGTTVYIELALLLTLMVGIIQLGFGLARMGLLVNFVSHTVVVGFTAGAAFLIANSQLKHILGIDLGAGTSFIGTWEKLVLHIQETNLYVLSVALSTLGIALLFKRLLPKWPYMLFGMVAGSIIAYFLGGEAVGIKTIGEITSALPQPHGVHLNFEKIKQLMPNAFAVALLGLIEAIAISKGIALQSRQRIDSNREFIAQGLSNIIGSFFSAYAGSGSFTRSGINYQAGAQTPMSAVFAAIILLAILLLIAPFAAYLPIPAMGGIILMVSYNLIDFKKIRKVLKASRLETSVLLVTFFSTLLLDLEFAILLGAMTSLGYFLYKTTHPHMAIMAPDPEDNYRLKYIIRKKGLRECPQLKMVRIDGSIFYGSIEHISELFDEVYKGPEKYCLILAEGVNFVGLAGAEWLAEEARRWKEKGGGLYVCNLKIIAQDVLEKGGYKKEIGEDHFWATKREAIAEIYKHLDHKICLTCPARVFRECQAIAGSQPPDAKEKEIPVV
ncbi:MAG: SulP family inorganic anion transporter [Saprospiraceae bacterium]|nr:SulP family inorganic anion transporter [Saprospiraceae bacterium]